jgi:hypothetical protein
MELDSSLGYRYMDTWVMSSVILLGTYRFCEKFLEYKFDPKGRQYDQMVQAARSGKNKGKEFWGCTGYPECRGTRRLEDFKPQPAPVAPALPQ